MTDLEIRRAVHERYKAKCRELDKTKMELARVRAERDQFALLLEQGAEMRAIAEAVVLGQPRYEYP
jgi:hypothetical protein